MFRTPQVVVFSEDVERLAAFYGNLGFNEVFRVPTDAPPIHIDVELDGYRLGIASVESSRVDHLLDPAVEGHRAVVVLWADDTPSAYARLLEVGGRPLHEPQVWLGRLLIAWAADPDGHPIQVVQALEPGLPEVD